MNFGQSKIEQLSLAALGDENIRGLDVAMNDALGMRCFERIGDLNAEIEKLLGLECPALDAMLESLALEQLHGDEWLAVVLADLVNRADVRMIQAGCRTRLALESFQRLPVFRHRFRQEFQRDRAPQFGVFRLEDHTHPAAAKLFDDSIVRDFRTGERAVIGHRRAS